MKILSIWSSMFMMVAMVSPMHADDTPLGKEMESINDSFKALSKEKDPAKGAALARQAQQGMLKGVAMVPDFITDMVPDPKEKEKATADYRRLMGESFVVFCKIEIAFLEGKMDEVTKLVDDAKALKKEGHKKYIEEE